MKLIAKPLLEKQEGGFFVGLTLLAAKAFAPKKKVSFTPRLQLVRPEKREGALKGKNRAADLCTAQVMNVIAFCNLSLRILRFCDYYVKFKVVIFLTSAVEVQPGWLEPLLARFAKDEFTLAAPVVDFIEQDNFAYTAATIQDSYGVFGWDLQFLWTAGDLDQNENLTDAFETPHIRGPVLAMSRNHFHLLGGFDEVECETTDSAAILGLVLKVWLCNGKVEVVPCSHVGVVNR